MEGGVENMKEGGESGEGGRERERLEKKNRYAGNVGKKKSG